ncbi:MAG: DUF2442 domain-containing protein [SAR202 cluster bacterium]|nr:DUF2442 domain-containing protein [SAR202 cluster bacterium]
MEIVTKVRVLRPYILRVTFSDGTVRDVDVESELYGEVFEPLKDPRVFAKARVDKTLRTVIWPNGADFSPEFLYRGAKSAAAV